MYNNPFKTIIAKDNCGDRMNKLFVKALKNKFEMSDKDAKELAKKVENIFHGEEEVEDMSIDKYERTIFYWLHGKKLLRLRREEIRENGKIMRKFYWSFNENEIKNGAFNKPLFEESPYSIYEKIPQKAWMIRFSNT